MKTLITPLLVISTLFCQAQETKEVKTFFIKTHNEPFYHNDTKVDNIDSADYIRTISVDKNNENLYEVTDYYLDKKIKKTGASLNNNFPVNFSGNVISYYNDGEKESEELYNKGDLSSSMFYNQNGTIKKMSSYFRDDKKMRIEKMEELNDSLGNHILDNSGTGFFKGVDDNGEMVEGNYLNGLKNKSWKTFNTKFNDTYIENYESGKFIKGKLIDAYGNSVNYAAFEVLPQFPGGLEAFGKFLSKNLNYPKEARNGGVEGRVYVQFVVEKDGKLTGLRSVRGIGSGCDEEALRVFGLSPIWDPGTQRGKPVRVSYTVPIFFKL